MISAEGPGREGPDFHKLAPVRARVEVRMHLLALGAVHLHDCGERFRLAHIEFFVACQIYAFVFVCQGVVRRPSSLWCRRACHTTGIGSGAGPGVIWCSAEVVIYCVQAASVVGAKGLERGAQKGRHDRLRKGNNKTSHHPAR